MTGGGKSLPPLFPLALTRIGVAMGICLLQFAE
jgi:hypothetical protein